MCNYNECCPDNNNSNCPDSGGGTQTIYVNSVSVAPGSVTLNVGEWFYGAYAEICPLNADCRNVRWYSDDPDVASVGETSGYICANSTGTARIYAEATDGSGCSDYLTVTVSSRIYVDSVSLDYSSISIEEGQNVYITATVCPGNASNKNLNWTSSNTSVARVSGGVVTGVSKGTARITATAADGSGKSASCSVSVTGDILVNCITVTADKSTILEGTSTCCRAIVYPSNANNTSVTWSSENNGIATVNSISGIVTAQNAGTTHIYATACDGSGVVGCCQITVTAKIMVSSVEVDPSTKTMKVGDTCCCLSATVYPSTATDKRIRWTSCDCNIADVDYMTGTVTAKVAGTTCICANAIDGSGVQGVCTVTVLPLEATRVQLNKSTATLSKGETVTLRYSVYPYNATITSVSWKSDSSYVASVSNGVVTAKNDGVANITVTINGKLKATCKVTVDSREKVTVKKDSISFTITFENNHIWKCVDCDLSLEANRTGYPLWLPESYSSLNKYEQRYVDNITQDFSKEEIAFIYRFDPLGIEYYMKNDACAKYDTIAKKLNFKDDVYKEIFGEPLPGRFYFTTSDNGTVLYGNYSGYNRANVYSNAEVIFGSHVIFDWSNFFESIATTLFESIPGVSYIQTGVEIYQVLFHSGSILGLYTNKATAYAEDYVSETIDKVVEFKLGKRATKCINWAGNLLTMLAQATVNSFVIPNINDITIYDKIEDQDKYNVMFENSDKELSMKDIIQLCSDTNN